MVFFSISSILPVPRRHFLIRSLLSRVLSISPRPLIMPHRRGAAGRLFRSIDFCLPKFDSRPEIACKSASFRGGTSLFARFFRVFRLFLPARSSCLTGEVRLVCFCFYISFSPRLLFFAVKAVFYHITVFLRIRQGAAGENPMLSLYFFCRAFAFLYPHAKTTTPAADSSATI